MAVSARQASARAASSNVVFVVFCGVVTADRARCALALILWTLVAKGLGGMNLAIVHHGHPGGGGRPAVCVTPSSARSLMCFGVGWSSLSSIGVMAGTWLAEYAGDEPPTAP